ncbi:MAG: glycoside hydrolase family 31 protein [Eubacteriales bacterium]|nr:glycoside hydrolase family 31 protein [Eubacteriales bacterium]
MLRPMHITPSAVTCAFPRNNAAMRLRVEALQAGALRITRTLREDFLPVESDVVIHREPGQLTVIEDDCTIRVTAGGITAVIDRMYGSITFLDEGGRVLLREDQRRPCEMQEKPVLVNSFSGQGDITLRQSVDGVRASAEDYETHEVRRAYACRQAFEFAPGEGLYGLGSHEEGYGNLRGKTRALYQHNLKAVVPVLVSTRGWGMLLDLGCMMAFHDDAEGSYLYADCADEMAYYFMAGGYPGVMRTCAALTGATPLPPRYAFGYVQSKERYRDAQELLDVVAEYRRREVPLDMIVLDWQSWPEDQWGYKVFDRERFPDPDGLTDRLHAMGAKMMISIWPSMQGERNENRQEMLEQGCMLGNRVIYDAFNPKARQLYWQQVSRGLFRHGIDAWWCDCSEPFEADWHGAVKPEPHERAAMNVAEAKKYLDPGKISLYSLYHSMGVYEGQRCETSGKRVLNLTRSSWAGQHRYGTFVWSGDVSATWETLRRQVPEGLNYCATGESSWTTDIGGFFPQTWEGSWFARGDFEDGVDDPGYRELYVRWLQLGMLLPMMRSHGTGTPREIWRFGERGTPWYDAIEKAIRLRSRLVPYLYTLADACTRTGMPMLRIPALMFPEDAALTAIDDELLLGDFILAKPVTRWMEYGPYGQKAEQPDWTEQVYLPAGTIWYAWEDGTPLQGGQTVTAAAPLDTVPMFVRAGAILPLGPVQQHVGETANPDITLTVYPGADGDFILYDDAGDGYGYEQGECARIALHWDDAAHRLTFSARQGSYPGMPQTRRFLLRLAGREEEMPVVYDGRGMSVAMGSPA